MTTHTIALARHTAQVVGLAGVLVLGTWDSYGTEQLLLRPGPEWEGLAIDATYHNTPNDKGVTALADTDGIVDVPPEACMRASKYATITFRGVQDGVQRISCSLPYMVLDHAQVPGANSTATPSENAQALAQMQDLRDGAVDAKNQAEAARDDAARSATAAAASEKAAASSAVAAAGSAAQAEAQKTAAAKSASDAQGYMQTASDAATAANASAENAEGSKAAAASSATAAAASEKAAAGDAKAASDAAAGATDAKAAAVAAQKDAAASKAAAANSSAAAKTSEDAAAKSAADADSTANSINNSMMQIAANKEAVSQLKEDTAALKKRQNVLVGSETGNPVSCNDAYSAPLCGLTVYGKSTQDGTPTPDAPVPIVSAGDGGSVVVNVTGTNMLEGTKPGSQKILFGITYVADETGIRVTGTASNDATYRLHDDNTSRLPRGVYYLSTKGISNSVKLNFFYVGSFTSDVQNKVINATTNNQYSILLQVNKGVMASTTVQVTLTKSRITSYSPYREQLLTLPTPNGLPGIPVTSGGNYTDQSGQRWVCDEVDFKNRVYVQRVGKRTITTQDTFKKSGLSTNDVNYFLLTNFFVSIGTIGKKNALMSNCFVAGKNQSFGAVGEIFQGGASGNAVYFSVDAQKYPDAETFKQWAVENGLMLLYQLTDIIETPLSPAEIAAYKALTAYAPDTVVQASDGAGIKLNYQRDVNLVVKNLEDAIASMTAT